MNCSARCTNDDEQAKTEDDIEMDKDEDRAMPPDSSRISDSGRQQAKRVLFGVSTFKYALSIALLALSITIAMALMSTRQTQVSQALPPAATIAVFWFVLFWMAAMEGCQTSLVGLVPVPKSEYQTSHPRAFKIASFIHEDANLERFIVGRQFLVVLAVFLTNLAAGSATGTATVLGLPDLWNAIFVTSGIAPVLIAVMIGQLMAQVTATRSMLDTINNWFVLYFVTVASIAIETSGLLHATYLAQLVRTKLSGKTVTTDAPKRTLIQTMSFWLRVAFSVAILAFAFALVVAALLAGKTTMWNGVPAFISVILLVVLMMLAGIMEGMQIAILAVAKLPDDSLSKQSVAKRNCDLVFQGDNFQAFLIGRQILVTACMFVVARITGMKVPPGDGGSNVFGVPDAVQETLFNSNILAAILTTVAASLVWRVVASASPTAFLSKPGISMIIRCCLIVEASGLCSAASLLARAQSSLCGFQPDEVYIGNPERLEGTALELELRETEDSRESDTESALSSGAS